MEKIVTVQDLIDRLQSVRNKEAEIHIVSTNGTYSTVFTPSSYDFSIGDINDESPDDEDGDSENTDIVILKMYR